jgi:hypothetical protein
MHVRALQPILGAVWLLSTLAQPAAAQPAGYHYTPPAGWVRAEQDGFVIVAPSSEPAGSAYMLILPAQPRPADFGAKFTADRTAFEARLGLRPLEARPPKHGTTADGEYLAWFASYKAAEGPRYMAYMARTEHGAMGTMVFMADQADRFDRLVAPGITLFNGMHLAAATTPAGESAPAAPVALAIGPTPASSAMAPQPGGAVNAAALQGRWLDLRGGVTLASLQGIWVSDTIKRDFRVSFGTQTGASGTTHDTLTSSMTTMEGAGGMSLKVNANGGYRYYHGYRDRHCETSLRHEGSASLQGNVLALQPSRAHETSRRLASGAPASCSTFDRDAPLAPKRYRAEMNEGKTVYGLASYHLSLTNVDVNESIKGFDRLEARPLPDAAPLLPNSTVPGQAPPRGAAGVWLAASPDTPLDASGFLSTTRTYDDTQYRAALRIDANGRYTLVVRRPDVMLAPACQRNLLLVEQGEARFAVSAYNPNNGNLVLQPATAHLTDQILHCDGDSVARHAELTLAPRHFLWQLDGSRGGAGDRFQLLCGDWPDHQAAWRFLACPQDAGQVYGGYVRQ